MKSLYSILLFIIVTAVIIYLGDSFIDGKLFGILGVLILTVIAYINWSRFGEEKPYQNISTSYPPKNLNSAEVKLIFSNQDNLEDTSTNHSGFYIASLIIYLASRGYIKIEMIKMNIGYDFVLYKQKEYDGENDEEKALMRALFTNSDTITKEELASKRIYNQIQIILAEKKEKYFEEKGCLLYLKMYGLWFGVIAFSIFSITGFDMFKEAIGIVPFISFVLSMFTLTFLFVIPNRVIRYIFSTLFFLIILYAATMTIGYSEEIAWSYPRIIFDTVCFIITSICFVNMSRRNEEGNILYKEILGFKNFLENVDKNRLEETVNDDTDYYNNVLPFALVLGKSEILINKLKDLIPITPDWYEGDFDAKSLNKFCNEVIYVITPKK